MADANEPPNGEGGAWGVLGDERHGVVERFVFLRGKLIFYFERRRCLDPEELADETLERVVQKLCAGTQVSDLLYYSYGVAKHVFQEYLRKERARHRYFDEARRRQAEETAVVEDDGAAVRERRLQCLERCVARLKEQQRWMLFEYYKYKGQRKVEHKDKIAEQLNISRDALTLRIFHLKRRLKKCIDECLENT